MQLELDTATIHSASHGEGRPIVFLHGWTMDHQVEVAIYEPIFATRPGWRRIYFDLPGMGSSIAKRDIRTQDEMLAIVLEMIERVLPGERFVLCGTSLGAYLARGVAVRLRERIDGLLLRVPATIPDMAKRTLPDFQPLVRNEALMQSLDEEDRTLVANALVQTPAYLDAYAKVARELVQPAIDAAAPFVVEMRGDPARYGFAFDLVEMEKTFDKPTLIIAARQDTVVGYRDAWSILESYPRATFAVVDRADHGWPLERPELLASLIDDWLARVVLAETNA